MPEMRRISRAMVGRIVRNGIPHHLPAYLAPGPLPSSRCLTAGSISIRWIARSSRAMTVRAVAYTGLRDQSRAMTIRNGGGYTGLTVFNFF